MGYEALLEDCFLYFQSGAAGYSQYDAVLQTLDVGIYYADAHGMAGLAATGKVPSHLLSLPLLACFLWMLEAFPEHQSSGLSCRLLPFCVNQMKQVGS